MLLGSALGLPVPVGNLLPATLVAPLLVVAISAVR